MVDGENNTDKLKIKTSEFSSADGNLPMGEGLHVTRLITILLVFALCAPPHHFWPDNGVFIFGL